MRQANSEISRPANEWVDLSWRSNMARWSIHLVRGRIVHLGTVAAATEEEAIAAAIVDFNVQPLHQNRVTASQLLERGDEDQQAGQFEAVTVAALSDQTRAAS
jgi:hypothetical protein